MTNIAGMTKREPRVETTQYSRFFTRTEVIDILKKYLEANGVIVPNGEDRAVFILNSRGYPPEYKEDEGGVNLVINVSGCAENAGKN